MDDIIIRIQNGEFDDSIDSIIAVARIRKDERGGRGLMPADYTWLTNLIEIEQALVFVRSREDVEDKLQRPLTDLEWEAVQSTVAWRNSSSSPFVNELINNIVWDAIAEAPIDP